MYRAAAHARSHASAMMDSAVMTVRQMEVSHVQLAEPRQQGKKTKRKTHDKQIR